MTGPTWDEALPDIVPTALHCLSGGHVPRQMATWAGSDAERIVLWLIDGFGYHQMEQALEQNLMPHLGQLTGSGRARLRPLLSVCPSVTDDDPVPHLRYDLASRIAGENAEGQRLTRRILLLPRL